MSPSCRTGGRVPPSCCGARTIRASASPPGLTRGLPQPGACRNPALAEERARKRSELLGASERELERIQARVRRTRQPLAGAAAIGQAVGAGLGRRKVAKHFRITVSDDDLAFARDEAAIAAEAALDGFFVLRTSVPAETLDAGATVRAYKSLAQVERAFRSLKTVDLDIRPVFHWTASRVTRNTVGFGRDHTTEIPATPTEIQRRAFDPLALEPAP